MLLKQWRIDYKPVDAEQKLNERFVDSLHKADYTEYILDIFTFGNMAERVSFYSNAENRKWVKDIERTVRSYIESTG